MIAYLPRWRIRNKVTQETIEVSAHDFAAACFVAKWRKEDCIGVMIYKRKLWGPPKRYAGGYPHRKHFRSD